MNRDVSGTDAENELAPDLFFGTPDIPNFVGAFTITGAATVAFASTALVGPPPGQLPCDWFHSDNGRRVILAELQYVTQVGSGVAAVPTTVTRYLSDRVYFDDENSRAYDEGINTMPRYNRSVDRTTLRGRFTSSIGTLELDNADGTFDDLLTIACDGSEVKFYIGDETWPRSTFIYVYSATPTKITASSWDKIVVTLKDNSLLLDVPVGGTQTIGGTGPNKDKFRTWNFGYVRQVECVLKDADNLIYVHSQSFIAFGVVGTIAVRDNGVLVGYEDHGDGLFGSIRLHAPPAGTVTADVLCQNGNPILSTDSTDAPSTPYVTRISDAFQTLVQGSGEFFETIDGVLVTFPAGPMNNRFAGPLPNFEYHWTNDYHVGISLPEAKQLPDVLDDLCDTGNCYYAIRRDGYFVYGQLRPDALEHLVSIGQLVPVTAISASEVTSIKIDHADPGPYLVQGYGNVNWFAQSSFATSLTPTQLDSFQRKGVYPPAITFYDQPGATAYLGGDPATGLPEQAFQGGAPQLYHKSMPKLTDVRTLISTVADVDATTHHLVNWQSLRRSQLLPWLEFIDITVDLCYFSLELGDVVQLVDFTRFGLANVYCQVVTVDIALTENKIYLGLVRRRPAITAY